MTRTRLVVLLALAVLLIVGASWLVGRMDSADSPSEALTRRAPSSEAPPSFSAPVAASPVEDATPAAAANVASVLVPPDTSTVIAGRVTFTTGETATGVRVFAWPPTEPPLAAELALDPPPRSALSDEAGRFSITGLHSGAEYTLGAAGRGVYLVRDQAINKFVAGTLDVAIRVGRIYGVHVLIRDENGERPVTNPALRGRGPTYQQPKGALETLSWATPLMEFVGLTKEQRTQRDPDEAILLCLGGAEPPEPMTIGGQVAGYERYRAEVPLGALSAGLPTFVIRARRLCEGFGRLTVQCLGTGPTDVPPKSPPRGRDRVWVEMAPRDEEDKAIGFALNLGSIPWSGASFDRIPLGRYSVRLWTEHRFLSVPFEDQLMRDFEVFAGENFLEFDVGALGAVELDVQRPDGSAWRGPVNVELICEAWGNIQQRALFGGAPFAIDALPVGRYRFHIAYPFDVKSEGDADGYVTVDGSGVQPVVMRP